MDRIHSFRVEQTFQLRVVDIQRHLHIRVKIADHFKQLLRLFPRRVKGFRAGLEPVHLFYGRLVGTDHSINCLSVVLCDFSDRLHSALAGVILVLIDLIDLGVQFTQFVLGVLNILQMEPVGILGEILYDIPAVCFQIFEDRLRHGGRDLQPFHDVLCGHALQELIGAVRILLHQTAALEPLAHRVGKEVVNPGFRGLSGLLINGQIPVEPPHVALDRLCVGRRRRVGNQKPDGSFEFVRAGLVALQPFRDLLSGLVQIFVHRVFVGRLLGDLPLGVGAGGLLERGDLDLVLHRRLFDGLVLGFQNGQPLLLGSGQLVHRLKLRDFCVVHPLPALILGGLQFHLRDLLLRFQLDQLLRGLGVDGHRAVLVQKRAGEVLGIRDQPVISIKRYRAVGGLLLQSGIQDLLLFHHGLDAGGHLLELFPCVVGEGVRVDVQPADVAHFFQDLLEG